MQPAVLRAYAQFLRQQALQTARRAPAQPVEEEPARATLASRAAQKVSHSSCIAAASARPRLHKISANAPSKSRYETRSASWSDSRSAIARTKRLASPWFLF